MRNEFYLVDYKGKFTIIQDKLFELDYAVGMITREQAIKSSEERIESSMYYGVPAYVGKDKQLNNIYGKY